MQKKKGGGGVKEFKIKKNIKFKKIWNEKKIKKVRTKNRIIEKCQPI